MKKIMKSLVIVVAVAAVASAASYAVFSDTALVENNTFSTGKIEIRANGQEVLAGFNVTNAKPGYCEKGHFDINNYGAPWFSPISTLNAEELVLEVKNKSGGLCPYLKAEIWVNRLGPADTKELAIFGVGNLDSISGELDLLKGFWPNLAVGNSESLWYNICLPADAPNDAQGKSCEFDFAVTGFNPERPE